MIGEINVENKMLFRFPDAKQMTRAEGKILLKNTAVIVGLVSSGFLLILIRTGMIPLFDFSSITGVLSGFILPIVILYVIVINGTLYIILRRNSKTIPESISVGKGVICIGEETFNFCDIEDVKLTSTRRMEDPRRIYATQRYLVLNTKAGKRKYWLGNRFHVNCGEYKHLCFELRRIFLREKVKIELCEKKSPLAW